MADDKISFLLDLDIKDFTEKGLQAKGVIEKLGSEENLSGLIEGLTKIGPALAVAGVAAFTLKKALDFTVEGEEIERVNKQFETLAEQAGIAPKELQEGLEKAGAGLVDTTDLLKIANEGLIKMGGSAAQLPQLLEIARKSVSVYGGDAKSNFQAITEAVSNGNVKMLQRYGISVDITKAEREFAEANGVTAGELSKVGHQQAILNAALESGEQRYKNIEANAGSATAILQRLKVTFTDIGETVVVFFEKKIGPAIRTVLGAIETFSTSLKLHIQATIGEGAEKAKAQAILAGKSVDDLMKKEDAQASQTSKRIQTANIESITDQEKRKKQQLLFTKEMQKIDGEYYKLQEQNIKNIGDVDRLVKQQQKNLEQQHNTAILQIRANADLTTIQKKQLLAMEDKKYHQQLEQNEHQTAAIRKKLLQQYVANSDSAFKGIGNAFVANSQMMKDEQSDFGKRGNEMWNSLSANSTSAFTQMGAQMAQGKDIGTATADALKGVFLGMLGDRAIAEGSILLLSSIWPPNPLGLGAGAGLLALGGALKSMAGSSGAPSTSGGSPSVQATASGSAPKLEPISSAAVETQSTQAEANNQMADASMATPQMESQQKVQRTVSVNIAGNYLETDQTKRMLMDLMRQESDATGFNYNQIGA